MPENFKQSKLVSSEGNKKVVDFVAVLEILPPGFKVQNPRIEITYFPAEKRMTTKTIDFQLADITSEYTIEPADGGKATIVRLEQTNKPKTASIVESLQKGAIRESYITQIRAANKGIAQEKARGRRRRADPPAATACASPPPASSARPARPGRRTAARPARGRDRGSLERRQVVADQRARRPPRAGAREPRRRAGRGSSTSSS